MGGAFVAAAALCVPSLAQAAPESWFAPSFSVEGPAAAGRFGEALSCSKASGATAQRSFVAVGAPGASDGKGSVHVYDSDQPATPIQIITPPSGRAILEVADTPAPPTADVPKRFGAAVAFISDINGDGADDLAVGEPRGEGQLGYVHVYGSSLTGETISFSLCQSASGEQSFGSALLALRGPQAVPGGAHLVVSAPLGGSTYGLDLSDACSGLIRAAPQFTSTGNTGRFGAALGEVPDTVMGSGDGATDVLVGQPEAVPGSSGRVHHLSSSASQAEFSRAMEAAYGASIGTSYQSNFVAVGSPRRSAGLGGVDISNGSTGIVCTAQRSPPGLSQQFGQSVANLDTSFGSLFRDRNLVTFAAYSSEVKTGGSVSLFSFDGRHCAAAFQVNNCQLDPSQEQGKVIIGGSDCQIRRGGVLRPAMLFSSPGWLGNRGRVDAVLAGTERPSPRACADTVNPPPPSPTPKTIAIEPGSSKLPAPSVKVGGGQVQITMPKLVPKLTGKAYQKALSQLIDKGLSRAEAVKALKQLKVTYVIRIVRITPNGAVSTMGRRGRSYMSTRVSNSNRSVIKLPPGQYAASYQGNISTKSPPIKLGSTQPSKSTTFRIR